VDRVVVPDDMAGERADRIVAVLLGTSRAAARAAVASGGVRTADGSVRPADRLSGGTILEIDVAPEVTALEPEPEIPIPVAYESPSVLVVDKPAGLVVHPGAGRVSGTLANGLVARYPGQFDLGPERRWGIVHRLDRDTSGFLMVARTPGAYRVLREALRRREVGRCYLALVVGTFDNATGTVDAPIGRDPVHPTRMAVTHDGRPSRTHYRRVAAWFDADVTLLQVRLETGRTHQIRLHLRSIGHPVVGDATYGKRFSGPEGIDPGRTWLHAIELGFPDPGGAGDILVKGRLPADLASSLDALGVPDLENDPGVDCTAGGLP
jgi:23S rRNA pseudouridine1911/1915/1917 synthase